MAIPAGIQVGGLRCLPPQLFQSLSQPCSRSLPRIFPPYSHFWRAPPNFAMDPAFFPASIPLFSYRYQETLSGIPLATPGWNSRRQFLLSFLSPIRTTLASSPVLEQPAFRGLSFHPTSIPRGLWQTLEWAQVSSFLWTSSALPSQPIPIPSRQPLIPRNLYWDHEWPHLAGIQVGE